MTLLSMLSTLKRRWANERGAVLVEAALAVPILMFVILGAVEAGMAWEAKSATTAGVRTGLLRAASIGDKPETDLRILQSIIGEVGTDNVTGLEWIVVFDASGTNDAATIETCRQAEAGGGVAGLCNTYGAGTQFADVIAGTITIADFDDGGNTSAGGYVCNSSKLDANWCAAGRMENGDIEIGVALSYQHSWFTGIFPGDGVDFEDHATSSTFIGEGSQISGNNPITPTGTTSYNSGSFDGPLNVGDATWSGSATLTSAPSDSSRNFLGLYSSNDSVDLTIANLASHTQICITFDLLVIGNWEYAADVNNPTGSEDVFALDVDGTNVHKSSYGDGSPPAGSTQVDTLGYTGDLDSDYVVTVTQCVPHTGSSVNFDFSSAMSAGIANEGWGIDNVVVTMS